MERVIASGGRNRSQRRMDSNVGKDVFRQRRAIKVVELGHLR